MVEEGWLNTEQAAEALGVTPNHLRQLQHRKKVKWGMRKGSRVYYHASEIATLREQRDTRKSQ
jgi:transposase-like protein